MRLSFLKSNLVQGIFSLSAFVISIVSLIVSIKSCEIAKKDVEISQKSYEVSLEPEINIQFKIDIRKDAYSLIIRNDGPLEVQELVILNETRIYDLAKFQIVTSSRNSRVPWFKASKLSPNDSVCITLNYQELHELSENSKVIQEWMHNRDLISSFLFKISFRKIHDLTISRKRKYLVILPANIYKKEKVVGIDPEFSSQEIIPELYDKFEKIERKKPWTFQDLF